MVLFSDAQVGRELITLKFDSLGRVSNLGPSSLSTRLFLPFFRFILGLSFDISWCGRCLFCYFIVNTAGVKFGRLDPTPGTS